MTLLGLSLQALGGALLLTLAYCVWTYFTSPIKHIPGPFVAKFTNFYRLFDVYEGRPELTQVMLHEQHGTAVRLGPNIVSISDPKVLRTIYNIRGDYLKSDFYKPNATKVNRQIIHNAFSTQSNEYHSAALRPIRKFYKLTNVLHHEPLVNTTITALLSHLDTRFASTGQTCPIDEWLLYFTWDVMSQMSVGKTMGFMDHGKDSSGLLKTADKALDYFATVGQIPWLDGWLAKNPIMPILGTSFDSTAASCAQLIQERCEDLAKGKRDGEDPDMLDRFLEVRKENPELMTEQTVLGGMLANFVAGSDTTAILLRSLIYYTLKNPKVERRLREEIDGARLKEPVQYAVASQLEYLDAVIKESMRIHPGVGLLLERIVPEGGLTLSDGRVIPRGTIVGMNAWVIHQNKSIYGQDASVFNPSRWLRDHESGETEADFQARLSLMKSTDLTFGAGNRVCLGKDISILEVFKIVPTLFLNYDMKLVDPDKEWKLQNSWFVRQSGIDIKIQRRKRV